MSRIAIALAFTLAASTAMADGPAEPVAPAAPEQPIETQTRGSSFPAETLVTFAVIAIIALALNGNGNGASAGPGAAAFGG
ncbi:hypothetical protein [Pelagovum pacificum]|uniref:Ferrochelatase n=1 Tax=Pelagovum pacificum TaxID=2588711 RepID=A0A5C5GKP5_9RHOB|nr:hypothetical protein [Pelagovum pacificum]QQA42845.1 hypothetical protein I8N54_19075 [Pelagovum pacificum]TNY34006.1 hypothetical protein FHY64_12310 [Pelagovum pacificum]